MFDDLPRPLLFAHRGANRFAPENTLPAFDLASRTGADVLELDVHLTRDHEVVVLHDATVDRTTDGHGPVQEFSYSELAALDAGYHFRTGSGDTLFREKDTQVPRLEEVLRAFPAHGLNIEIKQAVPNAVPAVLDLLERVGHSNVLLAAGNDYIMRQLEEAEPGCPLGMSIEQCKRLLRGAYIGGIPERFRGRALQIPPRLKGIPVATRRVIKKARAAGLEVHLWTINAEDEARKYLDRGVDGLMSDDPGALAGLFADFRAARGSVGQ